MQLLRRLRQVGSQSVGMVLDVLVEEVRWRTIKTSVNGRYFQQLYRCGRRHYGIQAFTSHLCARFPWLEFFVLDVYVAAQAATANSYLPILAGVNLLYILLLLGFNQAWTTWKIVGVLVTWAFQIFAYVGILESSKNNNKNKKKDLVGGVHLDLLALTVLVQFGTALHSSKWLYLLWIAPIYGGWLLYSTFFGGKKPSTNGVSGPLDQTTATGRSNDKREKRAHQRGQRRGY